MHQVINEGPLELINVELADKLLVLNDNPLVKLKKAIIIPVDDPGFIVKSPFLKNLIFLLRVNEVPKATFIFRVKKAGNLYVNYFNRSFLKKGLDYEISLLEQAVSDHWEPDIFYRGVLQPKRYARKIAFYKAKIAELEAQKQTAFYEIEYVPDNTLVEILDNLIALF